MKKHDDIAFSAQPEGKYNPIEQPLVSPLPGPARMSYNIPRLGGALKLLVDPQRDLKLLPRVDNENFGSDVVANGDFHNFTMLDDANVLGHWIFDDVYHTDELTGDAITADQSGNGNDLTAEGFSADFVDELAGGNEVYENGNILEFNGIDQYFEITSGEAGDFDFGVNDFTIEISFSTSNIGAFEVLIGKMRGEATHGWRVSRSTDLQVYTLQLVANGRELSYNGGVLSDGFHHLAFVVNRSANTITVYDNGSDVSVLSVNTLLSSDDISISRSFYIGRYSTVGFFSTQSCAEVRISNVARTAQEIKESANLANFWRTGSGAITPTNQSFAQRFTNSASSTDNMQQSVTTVVDTLYKLKFDGYRVSGSGNLTIALSGAHTKTLTYSNTVNARQVYYFLATTTSLTIDVYGSNAGDVYQIDNITIESVLNAAKPTSSVLDQSLPRNNGTSQNSLEDDQPAHPASFLYNGIDQFISFGDILTNDIESDVPKIIFCWARTTQSGTFAEIFGKSQFFAPQPGVELKMDSSNRFAYYQINTWSSDAMYIATVATINDGNWHFLAVADDGSKIGANMKMFHNGEIAAHTVIIDTLAGSIVNGSDLTIGARDTGLQLFGGNIGVSGIYLFTGDEGIRKRLPDGYKNIIKYIYNQTKDWYKN